MLNKFHITVQKVACKYAEAAFASCCGHRRTMEDHHAFSDADLKGSSVYFGGIFDGHGGSECSRDIAKLLPEIVFDRLETHSRQFRDVFHVQSLSNIIRTCVYEADKACARYPEQGSCAVFTLVWGNPALDNHCSALIGNLGDSRALRISRRVKEISVTQLTTDHKPEDEKEKTRIELAGGFVSHYPFDCPRTCGSLSLSRAFGDFRFKRDVKMQADRQIISSCVDLHHTKLHPGESLCLACDGVFEARSMDSETVGRIVGKSYRDAEATARNIVQTSIEEGSRDNNTCLVLHF